MYKESSYYKIFRHGSEFDKAKGRGQESWHSVRLEILSAMSPNWIQFQRANFSKPFTSVHLVYTETDAAYVETSYFLSKYAVFVYGEGCMAYGHRLRTVFRDSGSAGLVI